MIKLVDGTEWSDQDYHAQKAFELGCTRAEAKSWLLIQNYSQFIPRLNDLKWSSKKEE